MLTPISKDALDFDEIAPVIDRLVEHSRGELSAKIIWNTLASGEWWLASVDRGKAWLIVHPINFKTGLNVLEVVGLAGDGLSEWENSVEDLEKLARDLGFNRLRARGRKGWERYAAKHGWQQTGIVIEKDLLDS